MKFHLISETIDGSIKDIVQLKTLDSSLEYSQMFDALEDCPKDFQAKLIQALNSVGETLQASPVDVFNIVLCASNEEDDKSATKKMYNWWKAVFEILSRCDIPDDRKAEYDDLVDTLMAEVSKAGDSAQVNEAEEYGYEQANIEDEEVMLKDMEFAISKIGEIANRVQDLINFVNPYCQSVNEDNIMKFKKIDESDDLSNEMVEVTYYLPEEYKDDPDDDSWVTTRQTLGEVCGPWFDGRYKMDEQEGESVYRTSGPNGFDYFKFDNPDDDAKFLEYAEMMRGGRVDESGDSEEIDSPSEGGSYRIEPDINDFDDTVFAVYFKTYEEDEWEYQETFNTTDEALAWIDEQIAYGEEHPIVSEVNDGEWVDMDDLIGVPQTDPKDDDRGMRMESDVAAEAKVVQDVNDVWALLKVLEDDVASKNLKDLIDSHVRTEEEIMDAVDEFFPGEVYQTELNDLFITGMEDLVDVLGLDVNAYVNDGSFVDLSKPSTLAFEGDAESKPSEVNDDEKQFKGDDGVVKTLDNANKKVVSEMTIEQDINSAEQLERILWGQGKENFIELVSKYGEDEVMGVLEESGITNLTQMNDYLWFEMDSIEEMLGGSPDEDEEF